MAVQMQSKKCFGEDVVIYHIHVGMLKARLGQNALWNVAGMRAMAKQPCFSPGDRKAAGHAGRQAHSGPLNRENALV